MFALLTVIYILTSASASSSAVSKPNNITAMAFLISIFDALRSFAVQVCKTIGEKSMCGTFALKSTSKTLFINNTGTTMSELESLPSPDKVQSLRARRGRAPLKEIAMEKCAHGVPGIVQAPPTGGYNCAVM